MYDRDTALTYTTSILAPHYHLLATTTNTNTTTHTTAIMQTDAAMDSHNDGFKVFLNKVIRRSRKEAKPRGVDISAPFDFKKCNLELAGISADE